MATPVFFLYLETCFYMFCDRSNYILVTPILVPFLKSKNAILKSLASHLNLLNVLQNGLIIF